MTLWESLPVFIRFAVWCWAIGYVGGAVLAAIAFVSELFD